MALILKKGYRMWENGILPYEIDPDAEFPKKTIENIEAAVAHWNEKTNWRIVPRNGQRDYVRIIEGKGCASNIGCAGGKQLMSLNRNCDKASAIHEFGHAIGFSHEHCRSDRDHYIVVMPNRIRTNKRNNFIQIVVPSNYEHHSTYDYGSIMHYGKAAFIKNQTYNLSGSWRNSVFYQAGNNSYLFLKKDNGDSSIRQVDQGFIAREIQKKSWDGGETNIAVYAVGNRQFIFSLKRNDGTIMIHKMGKDGRVGKKVIEYDWSRGWTTTEFYTINGNTYIFLLKKESGEVQINQLNDDGKLGARIQNYDWSKNWTNVKFYKAGKMTYLFLYKEKHGDVHIHQMNNDGSVGQRVVDRTWTTDWKVVEFYTVDKKSFMLRMKSSGETEIRSMNTDGTIGSVIQTSKLKSSWTTVRIFEEGGKKYFWLLNNSNGKSLIRKMNTTGSDIGQISSIMKMAPGLTIYAPEEIGQRKGLSPQDIAAANYRI